jgi:hypothetical protein
MSGAGMFDAQTKSVQAAGTFTHKSSDGTTLETGVWIASELIRFESYGVAPGALMNGGRALGTPRFGPKHLPIFSGSVPTGGLAVFRIRLLPVSGASKTAVLQANCALGKVPAERQTEGIRLSLERNDTEFSLEASGRVMFLSTRPEASAPVKTPQQGAPPDPTETTEKLGTKFANAANASETIKATRESHDRPLALARGEDFKDSATISKRRICGKDATDLPESG